MATTILHCEQDEARMPRCNFESSQPGHGFWSRLIGRLRLRACFTIPTGYEDETGFHFGVPTREEGEERPEIF